MVSVDVKHHVHLLTLFSCFLFTSMTRSFYIVPNMLFSIWGHQAKRTIDWVFFCGCTSGGVYVPCMPGESYSCLCCCIPSANSLCVAFANKLVVNVWPLQKIAICLQMRRWWQHDGEFLAILQLTIANHLVTHLKLVSPAILLVVIREIQAWGTCGLTERWSLADWVLVSAS